MARTSGSATSMSSAPRAWTTLSPPTSCRTTTAGIRDLLLAPPRASSSLEALVRILESRGLTGGRLGVELEDLASDRKEELVQALPGAALLDASNLIRLIRMVKNEYEIELLTRSAAINGAGGDAGPFRDETGDDPG